MGTTLTRGDRYLWNGSDHIEVKRVARDGTWADLAVTPGNGAAGWSKRQPLPLDDLFALVAKAEPKSRSRCGHQNNPDTSVKIVQGDQWETFADGTSQENFTAAKERAKQLSVDDDRDALPASVFAPHWQAGRGHYFHGVYVFGEWRRAGYHPDVVPPYGPGDVILTDLCLQLGGRPRYRMILVTSRVEDIKNGWPGFFGVRLAADDPLSPCPSFVYGYDDAVLMKVPVEEYDNDLRAELRKALDFAVAEEGRAVEEGKLSPEDRTTCFICHDWRTPDHAHDVNCEWCDGTAPHFGGTCAQQGTPMPVEYDDEHKDTCSDPDCTCWHSEISSADVEPEGATA